MQELVILMLITVALAWFADHVTVRPLNGQKMHRQLLPAIVIFILLAGFVGLRKWYNDTETYRYAYEAMSAFPAHWEEVSLDLGANFGFDIINAWLKTGGIISQDFLMFWAVIVVGLHLFFLHKHAENYPLSIFLLFATGAFSFMCAAIKQTAAVAICLLAVHFFLDKKYARYVLCVLLASTIHPYALMFLSVPIFTYKPWTKKTYFFIALFIAAGLALQPLMGTIINITTMIGEEYTVEEFSQAGVNIFRVLVCNVPLALSFVYRKQLFADSSREQNLFMNLAMLNGAIMFVGLFGTANYFGRLANYFLVFQILSLPWMVNKIQGRDRKVIKTAMIICYIAYFYYAHAINLPFDDNFHRYTISEYLAMPR